MLLEIRVKIGVLLFFKRSLKGVFKMDENLDEEMEIMAERDQEPKVLNAETFSTVIRDVVPLKGVRSLRLKTTIGEAV